MWGLCQAGGCSQSPKAVKQNHRILQPNIKPKFDQKLTRLWASRMALVVKSWLASWGIRGVGLIPGLGRSLGGGHGNPLQYSCLENSMDRGAWRATVHGVAKSQTRLSDWTELCTISVTWAKKKTSLSLSFISKMGTVIVFTFIVKPGWDNAYYRGTWHNQT